MRTVAQWLAPLLLAVACQQPPRPFSYLPRDPEIAQKADKLYFQFFQTYEDGNAFSLSQQFVKRHEDLATVMDRLAIEPGMVVADIGCGIGYFTFPMARAAGPDGEVWAIDIEPDAIKWIQNQSASPSVNPYGNIRARVSRPDDPLLPPESIDLGLYSHMGWYMAGKLNSENTKMIANTYAAIKPGGRLAVLQWVRPGTRMDHLSRNFQRAGFQEARVEHFETEDTYLYTFVRPKDLP